MNSQKIRSQQHVAQQKKRRRRQIIALIVAIVILIGGLIGLTHWSAVQIDSFEITTEGDLPEEEIRSLVSNQLDKQLWYIIDRNNIVLLPTGKIADRITSLTPRIRTTDVDRTGLRSFAVAIQTRNPAAKVCPLQSAATSNCLLVDDEGFAYNQESEDKATSTELFVYQTDELPDVGTHLKSEETFRLLQSFIEELETLSFTPLSAELRDHEDVFIEIKKQSAAKATPSSRVQLRVNLADDLSQKFTNLRTVVEKDSFVASTTKETVNGTQPSISPFALEYIDLRFENKVFYR